MNKIDLTVSEETLAKHNGERLAYIRERVENNEQYQKCVADLKLGLISERINKSDFDFDVDIESFHWYCFCGVPYYEHREWGLRDDDLDDQNYFHYCLQKLPTEVVSELMKIWEQSNYYSESVEDMERLKDNVKQALPFLLFCTQRGIYLPTLIKEVIVSVERGDV